MVRRKNRAGSQRDGNSLGENEPTLDYWIERARQEIEPARRKHGAVVVYGDQASRNPYDLKQPTCPGDGVSPREKIAAELRFLWADVTFWKLVFERCDAKRLQGHIEVEHDLLLPELPGSAWKALAKDRFARDQLFTILASHEWRWAAAPRTFENQRLTYELNAKWLKMMLEDYLSQSNIEMTSALASQGFSKEALKAIRTLGLRLVKDANWCLKNFGKIPAPVARQKPGPPKTLVEIERIESFAVERSLRPHLSAHAIAKEHQIPKPVEAASDLQVLRKAAEIAGKLLHYREGIKVNMKRKP